MQLEAFSVSGYRCLADLDEIPLCEPTILTGANDSGKSTALAALAFLLGVQTPAPPDRTIVRTDDRDPPGGIDVDTFAEIRVTGRFHLAQSESKQLGLDQEVRIRRVLRSSNAMYEYQTVVCSDPALRDIETKSLGALKALATQFSIDCPGHAGQLATYKEPLLSYALSLPSEVAWVSLPTDLLQLLPTLIIFKDDDPEAAIHQALMGVYRSTLEEEELVSKLDSIESRIREALRNEADNLCEHLRTRCPELVNVCIEPQVGFRDQFPTVRIEAGREDGELVGLNASGTGRRQRIALATWEFNQQLLQRKSNSDQSLVICYDEPDNRLDYSHQRELADLVRQQSSLPGVRVILATHSLNLIDLVPVENVIHLINDGGRSRIQRLLDTGHEETNRFLRDLATAMGLRTSVLLHERCFVAVEGLTEAQAIPVLFKTAMGIPLQSAGLALVPANGNAGALQLAKHLISQRRPVRVIVDADTFASTSTKKMFRSGALTAAGIDPAHVKRVGTKELEDLFSDDQWTATANADWPRADQRPWTKADFGALRTRPKFSDALRKMVCEGSPDSAPENKPGYLLALALQLREAPDVPVALHNIFEDLVQAAS